VIHVEVVPIQLLQATDCAFPLVSLVQLGSSPWCFGKDFKRFLIICSCNFSFSALDAWIPLSLSGRLRSFAETTLTQTVAFCKSIVFVFRLVSLNLDDLFDTLRFVWIFSLIPLFSSYLIWYASYLPSVSTYERGMVRTFSCGIGLRESKGVASSCENGIEFSYDFIWGQILTWIESWTQFHMNFTLSLHGTKAMPLWSWSHGETFPLL